MSSETIVTALFLISAVIAAGVLINAIFPTITRTAETFGSASSEADSRIRTDFKIIHTYADSAGGEVTIWLKNVGSARLHINELNNSDIFIQTEGDIIQKSFGSTYSSSYDPNTETFKNNYWDPGETLTLKATGITPGSEDVNIVIVLPNGVRREIISPWS
ncbi:MAG: flagellin [Methanolinea sp.]